MALCCSRATILWLTSNEQIAEPSRAASFTVIRRVQSDSRMITLGTVPLPGTKPSLFKRIMNACFSPSVKEQL